MNALLLFCREWLVMPPDTGWPLPARLRVVPLLPTLLMLLVDVSLERIFAAAATDAAEAPGAKVSGCLAVV